MVLASVAFALMAALARHVSVEADPSLVVLVRSAIVGAVAVALLAVRGTPLRFTHHRHLLVRAVAGCLAMAAYFSALSMAPLTEVLTLQHSSPLFVAAASRISIGERVSRSSVAWLIFGFLGVLAVLGPPTHISLGSALAVASAASAAWAYLIIRRLSGAVDPDAIVVHFSAVALMFSLPWALNSQPSWDLTAPAWLALTGMGLCAAVGQVAMTRAYALAPAALVSGVSMTAVPIGAAIGIFAFGERPGLGMALGAVAIAASSWALTREGIRTPRPAASG